MSGPLPKPGRRRRNAPTIPTTSLPAAGRQGAAPKLPAWLELGDAGRAWWKWAWKTPEAAAWSKGALVAIARRASLEDDLATLQRVDGLDVAELLEVAPSDRSEFVAAVIRRLHALAGGRLAVLREMRELDDRLGLTPKAKAALRWEIVDTPTPAASASTPSDGVPSRRLRAVDPRAVARG